MKAESTQTVPVISDCPEEHYVGIRTLTPFSGMFAALEPLQKELRRWALGRGLTGIYILRFHVIDMRGMMDLEVGLKTASLLDGDERVRSGVLPAGRYASLIYRGKGRAGHAALLDWIRAEGLAADVETAADGDHFGCRYESYLTDPKVEPRKLLQDIQLSIKLRI